MMRLTKSILVEFVTVVLIAALVGRAAAQVARPGEPQLSIAGDVPRALVLTAAELEGMVRTTVTVTIEGRRNVYEGVLLGHLLQRASAPLGGS